MSKYKSSSALTSLRFAIRGIAIAVKSQRNFQIDIAIALSAIISATILNFSSLEMAVLVLIIGLVLFAELTNTVIEFVVDAYFGNKYSILAKMSKDISAGAVLLCAIISVMIGFLLFFPKIKCIFY